jgi:FkbM family methyltransferase
MHSLTRKLRTARRIHAEEGLRGIATELMHKLPWLRSSYWVEWLKRQDTLLGRVVELTGNRVRIEGCRFSVKHPAIPTWRKSLFLFDRYEIEERRALARVLDPELPVVEFGGSIGVVACVTNRRLRRPERHVVVEANRDLIPLLEQNRNRNGAGFTVLHRAVAYGTREVLFHQDEFLSGRVRGAGGRAVQVPAVSLQEIVDGFGFERCTLICDIEGEEIELVRRESDVLCERVATLIIEAHPAVTGAEAAREMLRQLEHLDFVPVFRDQDTWALQNTRSLAATSIPATAVD